MRPSLLSLAAAVTGTAGGAGPPPPPPPPPPPLLGDPPTRAPAAPASAADAVFGGTAKHGAPIVIKADTKAQRLKSLTLSWFADCSDGRSYDGGGELTPTEPVEGFSPGRRDLLVSRNAKGAFEGQQLYAGDLGANVAVVQVKVSGKLTAKRVRGTLSAVVKIADEATGAEVTSCQDSGSFAATRKAGTIFGGTTSQDRPIVLRVRGGESVDD